jgi:hypothetical protein
MHLHHIDGMVETVLDAACRTASIEGPSDEEFKGAIRDALVGYWADRMALVWNVSDVTDLLHCTDDEARQILDFVHRNEDADLGVNWDTIRGAADQLGIVAKADEDEDEDEDPFADKTGEELKELTLDSLLLVDVCMSALSRDDVDDQRLEAVLASWTDEQCRQAARWAWQTHIRASDNDHLPEPVCPPHVQVLRRRPGE